MIRIPCLPSIMIFRIFLATALLAVFFVGQVSGQVDASPVGPGVAGQIHAMAFDPDNPSTIIVGSDVGGVFRSDNNGADWTAWSEGLENTNLTPSMYVDDLLVLNDPNIDLAYHGVWAATHGGIYFRPLSGGAWTLQSVDGIGEPLSYEGRWRDDPQNPQPFPDLSKPIPFSSLAYDSNRQYLYAGTGHARWLENNKTWRLYYPEAIDTSDPQYSLWECDLGGTGAASWNYVAITEGRGTVRQVAVAEDNNNNPIAVFASRDSVLAYVPSPQPTLVDIWSNGNKSFNSEGVSWGVAAGSGGEFYCLRTAAYPELPGVYRCNLSSAPLDDVTWTELGAEFDAWNEPIPPYTSTLNDLLGEPWKIEMMTLAVVPGTNGDDEVYVGHRNDTRKNGLFRYGTYADTETTTKTGWHYVVFYGDLGGSGQRWDEFIHSYADWTATPIEFHFGDLEPGWCSNFGLHATAPPVFHPSNTDHIFVSAFHIPIESSLVDSVAFDQRYCTGNGEEGASGSWKSNGLNLGAARSIGISPDGRLVLGTRDFGVFRATGSRDHFAWLDWYQDASDVASDIEFLGETIVALMEPPFKETIGATEDERFGFAFNIENGDTVPQQMHVIGVVDTSLTFFEYGTTQDGYGWRYPSRGLDAVFGGDRFDIIDVETVGQDTIFAACVSGEHNRIYRHIGAPTDLSWEHVIDLPSSCDVVEMRMLPSTTQMIVGAKDESAGGVFCFDTLSPAGYDTWLDPDSLTTYKKRAFRSLSTIECDDYGTVVYLGTQGGYEVSSGYESIGAVFRMDIPQGRPPVTGDWELIANDEGTNSFDFDTPSAAFWPSGWGGTDEAGRRLTQITDITIDPRNPHHIYVGLYNNGILGAGCMHPKTGVWEFDPRVGSSWVPVFSAQTGHPATKGVAALEIDRADQTRLYAGTYGRGFFDVEVEPTPVEDLPEISERAEFALYDDAADMVWTTFSVRVRSGSGYPIEEVHADFRDWNDIIPSRSALNDTAGNGDLYAGDGIWSAQFYISGSVSGEIGIPVMARDSQWNTYQANVLADVIAPVGAMADSSAGTGDLAMPYAGSIPIDPETETTWSAARMPRAAVPFHVGAELDDPRPGTEDIIKALENGEVQIFEHQDTEDEVAEFSTLDRLIYFDTMPPSSGGTSVTVADFDNDGFEDVLCCNGSGGGAVNLYRYDTNSSKYVDVAADVFPLVYAAQAAAWGDYNQDGWVDLILVRNDMNWQPGPAAAAAGSGIFGAQSPLLYKNIAGTFVRDQEAFFDAQTATAFNVSWCDIDEDGALDLLLGDAYVPPISNGPRVFRNQGFGGNYQFIDVTSSWFDTPPGAALAAEFADLDSDGDADLVIASIDASESLQVFENQDVGGGGGQGVPALEVLPQGETHIPSIDYGLTDFVLSDLDLNGMLDIVTMPNETVNGPNIVLNGLEGFPNRFAPVNVFDSTMQGFVSTGFAYEWGSNGRGEVYLGRDPLAGTTTYSMENFFFRNELLSANKFVRLRLIGGGLCDYSALGARIDVLHPSSGLRVAPTTWVSGGNGRGRQNARVLTIGLTDANLASVDISVTWPDGGTTTFAGKTTNNAAVHILEDMRTVSIPLATMLESKQLTFEGITNWTFQCTSNRFLTDAYLELDLDPYGTASTECTCGHGSTVVTFTESTADDFSVVRVGSHSYQYTFKIDSWCCVQNCDYKFRIGGQFIDPAVSPWRATKKVKTCANNLPLPPPGP